MAENTKLKLKAKTSPLFPVAIYIAIILCKLKLTNEEKAAKFISKKFTKIVDK